MSQEIQISAKEQAENILTKDDVKEMVKAGKAVIILFNSVYDVTSFYSKHPGGKKIIQRNLGKDSTELFVSEGHLKNKETIKFLETMKIGRLQTEARL